MHIERSLRQKSFRSLPVCRLLLCRTSVSAVRRSTFPSVRPRSASPSRAAPTPNSRCRESSPFSRTAPHFKPAASESGSSSGKSMELVLKVLKRFLIKFYLIFYGLKSRTLQCVQKRLSVFCPFSLFLSTIIERIKLSLMAILQKEYPLKIDILDTHHVCLDVEMTLKRQKYGDGLKVVYLCLLLSFQVYLTTQSLALSPNVSRNGTGPS